MEETDGDRKRESGKTFYNDQTEFIEKDSEIEMS